MVKGTEELKRCGVWTECAYWATKLWVSPDGKESKWACTECARLLKASGWEPKS